MSASTNPKPANTASLTPDKHAQLKKSIESLSNSSSEDEEAPPAYMYADKTATPSHPANTNLAGHHKSKFHLGRDIKDRITHTTHEQRELERAAETERERRTRAAIDKAIATGEKQLVGKDSAGKDVYVDPPSRGQYNSYGYNPYAYGPYGYGGFSPYGFGGYGYGLGLGLGGLALGSLLFW